MSPALTAVKGVGDDGSARPPGFETRRKGAAGPSSPARLERMDHDVENKTPLLLPSPHHYHEGCPGCLLERRKAAANGAPPKKELFFVALLVLCNTLPIASLFPFIYFMVRDFGIAKLDTQIASYAGYIGSAVMLGRFMTSAPWGMVADRYGRKPVIIFGSASIVIFNTLFGFSTNFWMALTSRFLLGICNGMFGTVRAYASEICSEEHQALGLSMVGTMWGVGTIIGPAIGGYLAQPSEKYPTLFPSGSLFDRFSYALPCICISAFAVAGLVASFWIPETLHKHSIQVVTHNKNVQNDASDKSVDVGIEKVEEEVTKSETQAVKKSLWRNSGMVAAIFLNCLWAVHSMAYLEIFSLWAVSPEVYGGLGFSTSGLGDVLAVTGVTLLLFQLFLFPKLARFLGAIQTVRVPAALTTGLTAMYPLIASLSGITLWAVLISAAVVKNILSVSVFTGIFMLVNNSVVSEQRGAANGVSTSFMSLFQAVGPASAGTVFSWAQERTDAFFLPGMWMVFSILSALSLITLVSTFEPLLPHSLNNPPPEE